MVILLNIFTIRQKLFGFINLIILLAVMQVFIPYKEIYGQSTVTLCFRCDDFFAVKDHPIEEIYQTKQQIIEIFKKNNMPLTIGLIPFVHKTISEDSVENRKLMADDKIALLLKELINDKNFEIAMHGFGHHPNEISKDSEWIGLPEKIQTEKIEEGKNIIFQALGPFDLSTFIPPWNSFDLNTIKALKASGFRFLSGDATVVKGKSFTFRSKDEKDYLNLNIIPGTTSLLELNKVIELAKRDNDGTLVVIVLHPYDFQEYRNGRRLKKANYHLADIDNLLHTLKMDPDLNFSTIKDLQPISINHNRFSSACKYSLLLRTVKFILPHSLLNHFGFTNEGIGYWIENGRYLSEKQYSNLYIKLLLLSILGTVTGGFIFSIILKFVIARLKLHRKWVYIHGMMIFVLICFFIFLEKKLQILTAPNMQALLVLYLSGSLAFIIASIYFTIHSAPKNSIKIEI